MAYQECFPKYRLTADIIKSFLAEVFKSRAEDFTVEVNHLLSTIFELR
jgi:hypothetical protein